jgi:hypothetical protein
MPVHQQTEFERSPFTWPLGKVVITGGKTLSDIYDGWNRLWPTVKRFMTPALVDRGGGVPALSL